MANDLNRCDFIGRLGSDPTVRHLPSGDQVVGFSIAVGESWKDKNGEKQERTEWVNVTVFGKLAEICGEYLKKGSQVYISGKLRTEKYQDKNGEDRYATKIIADRMQMLGGKRDSEQAGENSAGTPKQKPANNDGSFDDMTDDIPF